MSKFLQKVLALALIAVLVFAGAAYGGSLSTNNAQADESAQDGCYNPSKVVAALNTAHAVDSNNVTPVLDLLNAEANKKSVKAGESVPNGNGGTVLFWTSADVDEGTFVASESTGVIVSLMGGGLGTVLTFYDSAVTVPVDGFYLDNLCSRINPTSMLDYWPGFKPLPAVTLESTPTVVSTLPAATPTDVVNPTTTSTPITPPTATLASSGDPAAAYCNNSFVDKETLRKMLNSEHAIDENDPRKVMEWLTSLGIAQHINVGDEIKAWQDSTVFWTTGDEEPQDAFTMTSTQGNVEAYFGGGYGTIFGLYDVTVTANVEGYAACMSARINPLSKLAGLDYWWKP